MNKPAALSGDTVGARSAGRPERSRSTSLWPWAAFHLLCLWTRSDAASVARMLGADGFDPGFGLDGRG